MSIDDTLSRRIRDEGSRAGSYRGHNMPDKAAEAAAEVERLKALRAHYRARQALVAAGIRPEEADAELAKL